MKKRIVSVLLIMAFCCALCGGIAVAAETRASEILSRYHVTLTEGDSAGEVKVNYDVQSSRTGVVGVESIEIYESDGTYVTTIDGTIDNGLLKSGTKQSSGTYTYSGTAGVSYYAVVTVSAQAGSIYDSRTVTTATV